MGNDNNDNNDNNDIDFILSILAKMNDSRDAVGKLLSEFDGTFRLKHDGSISFKYYKSGWGGGSRAKIKTYGLSKIGRTLSKAAKPISYTFSGYNVYNGYKNDGNQLGENCKEAISSEMGSIVGSNIGSKVGGLIGSLISPGIGTTVGKIAGAIIGGKIGENLASEARRQVKDSSWQYVTNKKKFDKKIILPYFNELLILI